MDEKQEKLQWWVGLKGSTLRLIAALGIAVMVESGVIVYKEFEKNRIEDAHNKALQAQTLAKEQAQENLRISSIKCAEDKAAVAQQLLNESKERVSKLEQSNETQKEIQQYNNNGVKVLSSRLDKIKKGVTP